MSVIPESVLSLLTWSNLERGVCGDREISLPQLKTACKYYFFLNFLIDVSAVFHTSTVFEK